VLVELGERLGHSLGAETAPQATEQLAEAVPFLAGLTLEEIGGRGVRWPERDSASALAEGETAPFDLDEPHAAPSPNGLLRLGTFRSLWASSEVRVSPALHFLHPGQTAELSPRDAERLGVHDGDAVEVAFDGTSVSARATLRAAVPEGSVFLADAVPEDSANALTNGETRLVQVKRR
jgi:NADH-quinone oxidoreductase subunit G